MAKVQVERKATNRVYIHNDLQNGARYFLEIIQAKQNDPSAEGIFFDCLACMTMLAFAFEACLNFVGDKAVNNWDERLRFKKKINRVFNQLGMKYDASQRPYSSIETLKEFRDTVAHGKPLIEQVEESFETTPDQIHKHPGVRGPWEEWCQPQTVFETYDDVDQIWKLMLEGAGIHYYDTLTSTEGTLTVIDQV